MAIICSICDYVANGLLSAPFCKKKHLVNLILNTTNNSQCYAGPTKKEDFTMKVKYVTEKETEITENTEFRMDFLNNLASSLAKLSFKDDSIPYVSIEEIRTADKLDDWHRMLYCTLYYEGVIKHLAKVFSILNAVTNNYYILSPIPDTADDKINYMMDLDSHYHFSDLPTAINLVPATIIKKHKNSEEKLEDDDFIPKTHFNDIVIVKTDFTDYY